MRFYSNGYGSSVAGTSFGLGLAAVIISIILTILLAILVVPEKRRNGLPKFFQVIHDICNFKGLLLEKVLKILYIFSTINVMLTGIFTWFSGGYNFGMTFLTGLLILVLGPILVRLAYEFLMLFVLLVKNVIQINNKLNGRSDNPFANNIDLNQFKILMHPNRITQVLMHSLYSRFNRNSLCNRITISNSLLFRTIISLSRTMTA